MEGELVGGDMGIQSMLSDNWLTTLVSFLHTPITSYFSRGEGSEEVSTGEKYFITDVIYNGQLLVIIETMQLSLDILIFLNALQLIH